MFCSRQPVVAKVSAWLKLSGLIVADQFFGFWFYWKHFPTVFSEKGASGMVGLFFLQFTISVILLYTYDCFDSDLFGLVAAKDRVRKLGERIRKRFGWQRHHEGRTRATEILEFFVCFWKFFPFVSMLVFREQGRRGNLFKEWIILFCGTAFNTLWYSIYAYVVYHAVSFSNPLARLLFGQH